MGMYIKGGLKKMSKAMTKAARINLEKAQKQEKEKQTMEKQEKQNIPVYDNYQKQESMSIKEKIGTWNHNFSQLDEQAKFFYLLEQGKGIVQLDETKRITGYRVYGCVSQVWVLPSLKDEKMFFEMDADSHEARGVVYILQSLFSGHKPSEILEITDQEIIDIGFFETLISKRRDGTFAVVNAIRSYSRDMLEMLSEQ